MLGRLLQAAISDSIDTEIHDRALLYYRLLEHDVRTAAKILGMPKSVIDQFAEERGNDVKVC